MDMAKFQQEIYRLTGVLDQTHTEIVQLATYGLSILEEKQALTKCYEELENLYKSVKQELEIIQEALTKFQTSKSGIEEKELLSLYETAPLKSSLNPTTIGLENDTESLRKELEHVRVEAIRENNDFSMLSNESNHVSKQLSTDLLEAKSRVTCLLSDYSELEEKNITLQKQIAHLKSSQVEFGGLKHEIHRLQQNEELLYLQVDELVKLKKNAEKQKEEALQLLQSEREAKYALKKELDQRINNESAYSLRNLAFRIRGICRYQNVGSDDEDDQPVLCKLENDISSTMELPECNIEKFERQLNSSEETLLLKNELIMLKNKLFDREQKTMELESNIRLLGDLASDASTSLDNAQNYLVVIIDELAQLALQMSVLNGKTITINTIVVKTAKKTKENDPRLDVLRMRLKADVFIKELDIFTKAPFVAKSLKNVLGQIKLLKESVKTSKDNA